MACKTSIVLDCVAGVQVEVREIKFVAPVGFLKIIGGEFRDEEAEG